MKFILFAVLALATFSAQAGEVLSRIKQSGVLTCGVRTTANAFVYKDGETVKGIDAEICSAIAQAVIGRGEAFRLVPVNTENGVQMLAENKIDVLLAGVPDTMRFELNNRVSVPAVFYHSALAFIGHFNPEATSMRDYAKARVCVDSQPYIITALENYNRKFALDMRIMKLPSLSRAKELLYLKRCDLILERLEILHSDYFKKAPADIDLVVLPEIVKTYATGPVIRDDDPEFEKVLRWLILGLIRAEQKGVSSQNVEDFQNTEDPEIKNLLADDAVSATKVGLDSKWLFRTIAEQGNYGEIIARGLGDKSALKLNRGANRLVEDGGQITAPSFEE